jgi:hypothetical protein
VSVAAGAQHSLALAGDQTLFGWGTPLFGELGPATVRIGPSLISTPFTNMKAVYAGQFLSAILLNNGTVAMTGWNSHGQCGLPADNARHEVPNVVDIGGGFFNPGGKFITDVALGTTHVLLLTSTSSSVSSVGELIHFLPINDVLFNSLLLFQQLMDWCMASVTTVLVSWLAHPPFRYPQRHCPLQCPTASSSLASLRARTLPVRFHRMERFLRGEAITRLPS